MHRTFRKKRFGNAKAEADHLYARTHRHSKRGVWQFTTWPTTVPVALDISLLATSGLPVWRMIERTAAAFREFGELLEGVKLMRHSFVPDKTEYVVRCFWRDPTTQITRNVALEAHARFRTCCESGIAALHGR